MAETLVERLWAWLHETFPERQIYVRSDGRVQFFTFGPSLQATLAGLTLVFLGWVAFATVNVIFKDRIISAKDHRYQQMQSAYENRVADLQTSYDELNGALVSAEDKFKATADELQTKQNTIVKFLDRKHQVDALFGGLTGSSASNAPASFGTVGPAAHAAADSVETAPPPGASDDDTDAGGGSVLQVMPQPVQPQPRTAKPTKASLLDFGGAVGRIAGALFGKRPPAQQLQAAREADAFARHPSLRALAAQTARVKRIGGDETVLMARTQTEVADGIGSLRGLIRGTGIDADQFAQKYEAMHGVGGPDIPLQTVRIEGISDRGFQDAYLKATAVLTEMDELLGAMRHIPLDRPGERRGIRPYQRLRPARGSDQWPLVVPPRRRFRRSVGSAGSLHRAGRGGLGRAKGRLWQPGRN